MPVPNTNIASNVGPQFDPKDVDYLEVQRGGYNAEYGDRTYGVFNVVTRSGFERHRQGELVLDYGSYNSTNPQISLSDHSDRFAWYGILSGYRTELGLETPAAENLHNLAHGLSGFGSLIFNQSPSDQLRLITSVRGDHYQVPNDPGGATGTNTLLGGNRPIRENAADPRVGAALQVPKLHWVARAFWGRYYQAPPLLTVSGPILAQCNSSDCGFLPLHGERDQQREFGLTIPFAGWTFDVTNFRTAAKNFFDHAVLGNSNIFFPLTIDRARVRGWEATANSPRIAGRAQFHLAYSHQYAEGAGAVTGGLTNFSPPDQGYFFLDHDQRDTVSSGLNLSLPRRAWTAVNVNHGSGFLNGNGPGHLPAHTTVDLSLGKSIGENWSLRLSALNVGNNHHMLDDSNTFGGSHFTNPREITLQLKYRFHF